MAKKELMWAPLLGGYLMASGAVFVDRRNNTTAVESLKAAGDFMKKNTTCLWLFPEGTRSMREHHDLLPFKKGAFHTAVQAGVPVTPVVCENYWKLYRKGHFESGVLRIRGKLRAHLSWTHLPHSLMVRCSNFSSATD
jgi:lysophosphatidate acyltransferase